MNKEETNQYKISVPLLNAEELVKIDNYYDEIVDEFVKVSVKKRDDVIKQRIMMNLRKENQQLKDNWNKLKEYISIKLYNTEYLQKLCGCRIDDINHMLLDIIRNEMQELERAVSNERIR